jgi:Tol biopolymer transport system component/C-terminal processing protease CtpA/Prc
MVRLSPRVVTLVVCLASVGLAASPPSQVVAPFAAAEPGVSADGSEIAFASGGDIWSVPTVGGDARLLISHEATERRPLYSPDGRSLAFMSTRTGGGDIYTLSLDTGALRRVTSDDGAETLEAWSPDSRWIYFSSTSRDIAGMNDVFRVSAQGGTPMLVSDDRYVNEFHVAPSPGGDALVLSARGIASAQWWRRGSSHIDQSELWLLTGLSGTPRYQQLTTRDARQVWPLWSADGRSLFYVSDRSGAENIWKRALPGPAGPPADAPLDSGQAVTTFTDGRVLFPTLAANGRILVFERNFGVWTMDPATGATRQIPIRLRGAAASPVPERQRLTTGFSDLALSPDGRKVAFVSRGILFAASAKETSDATRVTTVPGIVSQPVWAPDSRRVAFVAARAGTQRLYLYDFVTNQESALTTAAGTDISPVFSADGTQVAFLRDRRELRVVTVATRAERLLATGAFADAIDTPVPVWGPGGRWIALFVTATKSFTNVNLVPTGAPGGPPRPVSFLSNVYANTIAWSPDGQTLLFDTRQRTEPGELARVDLAPRTPKFREDLFRDLFTAPSRPSPTAPSAPTTPTSPVAPTFPPLPPLPPFPSIPPMAEPVFDGIRSRLSLLPLGLDVQTVTISPDGKMALVTAAAAGQTNLYTWPLDEMVERPVARQLTTTAGAKSDAQFSADSKEVYYLEGGRIQIATVERRESRPLSVTAEFTTDFAAEKMEVFREAWTLLRDNFFDPSFHGVNWEASREQYGPLVAAATTPDDMRRVMSLMIGDLNASHLGLTGPGGGASVVGQLGLRFDRRVWETTGQLRVNEVVKLGPADVSGQIATGDFLRTVAGQTVAAGFDLHQALAHTVDRRVVVSVSSTANGAMRDVALKPVNLGTDKALVYRQWVERNREYVLKTSGGRLGYVHMLNMSDAALDQLHIDLDAENHERDGVVIDLRNNNGGFVNAYALDVFARQPYLKMSLRGLPESPARTVLGQRALESATVLVVNQHSLSDAEDFTEGYRALKLGPIVGEPTAGWIIYTWNQRLVDGSTLRLPRMRIRAADGTDMEMHPRPVDVEVSRPLGEQAATGRDTQLDRAIRTLLLRLGFAE